MTQTLGTPAVHVERMSRKDLKLLNVTLVVIGTIFDVMEYHLIPMKKTLKLPQAEREKMIHFCKICKEDSLPFQKLSDEEFITSIIKNIEYKEDLNLRTFTKYFCTSPCPPPPSGAKPTSNFAQ